MGIIEMESIDMDMLEDFVSSPVEVSIQDEQGNDKAAFLKKEVKKIQLCPDQTHVRIYFDQDKFLAVPRTSTVSMFDNQWTAFDMFSDLYYVIRKVR
ncbi:hypothetical protein ACFYKX_02865 [Cytobacillus sp. FJAT-54145]|uniref:Uncharacterized protein n=1 Tax=Cytobacillus spartinae TaxID=3299023 RepID=A0ABW6K8F7_9BACI